MAEVFASEEFVSACIVEKVFEDEVDYALIATPAALCVA
jgi:hypothetical protein